MGWNRGTELFDGVVEIIGDPVPWKELVDLFADFDWDTPEESNYWGIPAFKEAVEEVYGPEEE